MKFFVIVAFVFLFSFSFGQTEIRYSSVFKNGTELVNDLSFRVKIESDSNQNIRTFVLKEFIQDSILSNSWEITVTKSQIKFNQGHIGTLFHGFNKKGEGFFIYMMDNYCIVNKLMEGKTNYTDSKTIYTLMSGK